MAIGYARLEFVKRSSGKNACAKAAYNSRSRIEFEGTKFQEPKTYDWSGKEEVFYHDILVPDHVDEKFKSPKHLWNAVEKSENRKDSQLSMELVLALPDDKVISTEEKIELAKSFVREHFVSKGLGIQLDVHKPEKKLYPKTKTSDLDESEDHNWHAHALITIRRFDENGKEFEKKKPRDLFPEVRNGRVTSGDHWGKLWIEHQNQFFEDRGLDLRVDPSGVVSQKHLGPVRMRARATALLEEQDLLQSLNKLSSLEPRNILEKLTETQSIFTKDDFERFLKKHVEPKDQKEVAKAFWCQPEIIKMYERGSNAPLNKFSSQAVYNEEQSILRLSDRLYQRSPFNIRSDLSDEPMKTLTKEQKVAFNNILSGRGLSCIEGHAGTGKSYLLKSLKDAYEGGGYRVRAFGPDNATSKVLSEKGFQNTENVYRFLFCHQNGKRNIRKGNEVWIIDEAGKLGNRPLLEILRVAEKNKVQVILSGNTAQLPSVERGGMFKVFCDRYGFEFLGDIQRQKNAEQRLIARKLALGEISEAFDKISATGGFRWSETKEEALDNLVRTWARDKIAFPNSTSIMIANSNKEVRALNEMARLYRRERGEIEEKEYLCQTAYGKLYVSVGDRIEFRKNDRDLSVTNGSSGTLIKASPESFTVQLKEKGSIQNITFDPREYPYFHLGYAFTYNRSQGRTIDRGYILHSRMMNKEMFYVGLTRHIRKAYCFVSASDAKCLSSLKVQALRSSTKETTLNFTTREEILRQKEQAARETAINSLKDSNGAFSKIKGYSLEAWDDLKGSVSSLVQGFKDKTPDNRFFNPIIDTENLPKGHVVELGPEEFETEISKQALLNALSTNRYDIQNRSSNANEAKTKQANWHKLSADKQSILEKYYRVTNEAKMLHIIVNSECESSGKRTESTSHFREYQKACALRNESALFATQSIPLNELKSVLTEKGLEILQSRAEKHKLISQKISQNSAESLESRLVENIEPLLHSLFPEGPSRRDNKGFRFGSKGSLAVSLRGQRTGTFYDFEKGEGGGLIKLIQATLGMNFKEAKDWAHQFLGGAKDLPIPTVYAHHTHDTQKGDVWISVKPEGEAPPLEKVNRGLAGRYIEAARYAYRDNEGSLLFYTLRLVSKDEKSKKIVLPLSYGYLNEGNTKPHWSIRGYQSDKKPLYGLEKLYKDPSAPVLIVEGEKAADAASKNPVCREYTVISWIGGTNSASKADWKHLYGRDVVIWPDNDQAGFKAAGEICIELRKVGVKSLKLVDQDILTEEFPEKWDLADQLPEGKNPGTIRDLILNSEEKTVGLNTLVSQLPHFKELKEGEGYIEKMRANEILWRVEERMRPEIEKEHRSKPWEIRQAILSEACSLINSRERISKELDSQGINGSVNERLTHQKMIWIAERGVEPTTEQVESMRQSLSSLGKSLMPSKNSLGIVDDKEIKEKIIEYSFDRVFCSASGKGVSGRNIENQMVSAFRRETESISSDVSKELKREISVQNLFEKDKIIQRQIEI